MRVYYVSCGVNFAECFFLFNKSFCLSSFKLIANLSAGSVEENSEDIPIDDVDELDEDAVDSENENS